MREVRGVGQNEARAEVCDLIKTGSLKQRREEKRRNGKREKKAIRAN